MSKKDLNNVVGAAYEDLNAEDMEQVQGAGDIDAETTVPVIVTLTGRRLTEMKPSYGRVTWLTAKPK